MAIHPAKVSSVPEKYFVEIYTRADPDAGTDRRLLVDFWFPEDFEIPRYSFGFDGPFPDGSSLEYTLPGVADDLTTAEDVVFHLEHTGVPLSHGWFPKLFWISGPRVSPSAYHRFRAPEIVTDREFPGPGWVWVQLTAGLPIAATDRQGADAARRIVYPPKQPRLFIRGVPIPAQKS